MSASFEAIFLSRPFKFIVGTDEVPIIVHEEALADQSAALSTLMRGKMSESLAGEAKWKDVDKETFIRFTQFAYTGDYSVPPVVVKASSRGFGPDPPKRMFEEDCTRPESEAEGFGWGSFGTSKMNKKEKVSPSQPMSNPFKSLTYPLLKPRSNLVYPCDPTIRKGSSENISEVLLIHAALYVLADKWRVNSLKRLTLSKLHKTLCILNLDKSKVPHIVQLASYAYSDERTPDLNTRIDELRELIWQYVAANAEVMSEHATFINLIEEGGAFVRDLWKGVLPKIRRVG